ncbi:winged helix-turn-helix domain-containing protein [Candidatus Thorarchaeota archaeon]|nr:MAG: winged helix-turn-helix domain-containing protein [Candidatus Thorarchaeota archaeon]
MNRLNKAGSGSKNIDHIFSGLQDTIHTPFDNLLPKVEESAVQFYIDAMRIYLGLCEGTISMEEALKAVDYLKENPEYATFPTNPTIIPINQRFKLKMLDNLKTLNKFNLFTKSAIRSAYNFAFLIEEAPITNTDLSVLTALSNDPLISLVEASRFLNLAPRTVARSLERLQERHQLRVSTFVDTSAFNLQSVMLFFVLREGIEWDSIETGLQQFPFTKSILKTTMTDIGYITFLIPNYSETESIFQRSIKNLSRTIFEYSSLHRQTSSGSVSNVNLFSQGSWRLPEDLEYILKTDTEVDSSNLPPLLSCSGMKSDFTKEDFAITAQLQMDFRSTPSKISEHLVMKGWDTDPRRVSSVIRRLQSRNLLLPYIIFALPKLSSNFCFEITCSTDYKSRILEAIRKFPWVMYYLSDRGIIVWTMTPGEHQVDYYQLFRALEQRPGINSVQPIMTISQQGSRSMMDLTRNYAYENGVWSVESDEIDIGNYIEL